MRNTEISSGHKERNLAWALLVLPLVGIMEFVLAIVVRYLTQIL
jgi:hypothetical protein